MLEQQVQLERELPLHRVSLPLSNWREKKNPSRLKVEISNQSEVFPPTATPSVYEPRSTRLEDIGFSMLSWCSECWWWGCGWWWWWCGWGCSGCTDSPPLGTGMALGPGGAARPCRDCRPGGAAPSSKAGLDDVWSGVPDGVLSSSELPSRDLEAPFMEEPSGLWPLLFSLFSLRSSRVTPDKSDAFSFEVQWEQKFSGMTLIFKVIFRGINMEPGETEAFCNDAQ